MTTQAFGPGPDHPGQLVDPAGLQAQAGVTLESYSNPQAIGHEHDTPGKAGRTRGRSDPGPSGLRQLVEHVAIGPKSESPGTAGQHRGALDHSASRPGQLVDPAGNRTLPGLQGQLVEPEGLLTRAPMAQDSWLTSRALGRKCEWPGRAGRPHRPSEPGQSPLEQLIDPLGPNRGAGVARDIWLTRGVSSTLRALRTGPEWPKTSVRPRGPSDTSSSHPGRLLDITGNLAWARVARESWSTPQSFRHRPESPGTLGGPCCSLGTVPSPRGQLVDP